MGAPMTRAGVLLFGKPSAATPLLGYIAGPHAERIARFWPVPHAGFLTLPSARRHAAAILLERRWSSTSDDGMDIVRVVERARDAELARILMSGDAPGGLMKALGRMGEQLWEVGDYANFLSLFADPEAVKVLRHMPQIRADRLGVIVVVPEALRVPGIVANLPETPQAVEDLAVAYQLARLIHGVSGASRLVQRWERANSPLVLFDMAAEALQPVEFGRVLAPPALPDWFEPVRTRKALNEMALEFRNCLRDFAADLAMGRMAVYAVRKSSNPPVALALRQDVAGWRLAEALLKGNDDLSDAHLRQLIDVLTAVGVRTGESAWALSQRLHDHVCPDCGPAHLPPRTTWRQRLALGSLWD